MAAQELETLRAQDAELRETSREQLVSLQAGLVALTSTLDQRENARREQSEQRLLELRELQGALASHGRKKRARVQRRRPSSARRAADRSTTGRATRRPRSAQPSRDGAALAVGGHKSARTVACATGAVKELGRNSLMTSELASAEASLFRRSGSVHDRERPWRDGDGLTERPSAAEIVAASQVSDTRLIAFNRKIAAESQLYKDVIARSDMDWDRSVARPKRAGRLAHTAHDLDNRNSGSVDKILSTTDELLGLESEITGKWRRSHRPKSGPVRLRPGGKSLLARSAERPESSSAAVLQPRRDASSTCAAVASSQARRKAVGLRVEIPESNGSETGNPPSIAGVILGMRSEAKKQSAPESMLELWAQDRAVQSAKKKINQMASNNRDSRSNAKSERSARAERMFRDLDADNSGTLDRAELQALASALGTTLSDHEISEAMAQVDKNGDGSVDLEEFLEWYESNHSSPNASPTQGTKNPAAFSHERRWYASESIQSVSVLPGPVPISSTAAATTAVNMPQNFIWVHLDAASRIQTLKADVSRLDRQLVDTAVLDKMHKEVLNPHSELLSMQLTMRTLRGSSRSQHESVSSSFAHGMSQADKAAELLDQILGHASALLSKPLPASRTLRERRRASSMTMDSDTKKASALLALAKQHNATPSIKTTIWAGRASCMVRQGKPRAALKLLRKCSAALKSNGASNVERANGWLNESAAMSVAGDHAGALGCAEKAAAIMHEDIDKFETSATVAGFFQRALITRDWLDTACLLCMSLYGAAVAHLAQGQRAPAVAALQESVAVANKWLGPERPVSRVLARVRDGEVMETLAPK